jgi:DNA replication protein DnaC
METDLLLREYLKRLNLSAMARELERVCREAAASNWSYESFLQELLEVQVIQREQNALKARIVGARFPIMKTLDTFDFSVASFVPKQKVLQLARGDFVEASENLILVGGSGTGKTHLATAIGICLCQKGKSVRFYTVADLVNALTEAQASHTLSRLQTQLNRIDLVVLDELGYVSLPRGAAELLFSFCASRHERRSLCITTNLEFSAWPEVFGDSRMTAALVDRLTHRAHILVMNGESYRFRQSLKTKGAHPASRPIPQSADDRTAKDQPQQQEEMALVEKGVVAA